MTWVSLEGYEGFEISDQGEIRCTKYSLLVRFGISDGRSYFSAHGKTVGVHRLVAKAFIPNPEGLPIVNRLDENKLNNRKTNLEWTTPRGNTVHSIKDFKTDDWLLKGMKLREARTAQSYYRVLQNEGISVSTSRGQKVFKEFKRA